MKVTPTHLPEVKVLQPQVHSDDRGHLFEFFRTERAVSLGIPTSFDQLTLSTSHRGVLRGLHYQLPQPQGKLISVLSGAAYDVAVDIRQGSESFGKWTGVILNAQNKKQIWIPEGFAHGFLALEDRTTLLYACTSSYLPRGNHSIAWDDPQISISWPIDYNLINLSHKDQVAPKLSEVESHLLPKKLGL